MKKYEALKKVANEKRKIMLQENKENIFGLVSVVVVKIIDKGGKEPCKPEESQRN